MCINIIIKYLDSQGLLFYAEVSMFLVWPLALIPSHFGSIKLFCFHGPNYTLAKFHHEFLFFQDIFLPVYEGFHMTAKKGENHGEISMDIQQ